MSDLEARLGAKNMVSVALAAYDDVFPIHKTMIRALEASETPFPAPDMPYAVQACLDLIAQGLVGVARAEQGSVVGCVMLDYARWPWCAPANPEGCYLYNQHFWVEPKYRAGGTASRLIRLAHCIADAKKLPLVLEISSIDEANADLRDRFVKMHGFRYTGGKFYRPPKL